ncbi:Ras-related protein Rab-32B-like [Homarus americanus]|uniref:Ras-related protein Rab-32B-like n=1 Tax=Homarus americanus TaxID=6706 RepID=A0A8J5JZ86_HOMAM|nr:Ras-related protein Rab-32B-like [Homarus americanus]
MTAVAPVEHSTVPRELQFKVLVIGEFGVGKTAVIRRYTEGHFSPYYKLTIGVDFAVKTLDWDAKTKVTVQLWDIAGHERFGHMTRVYYKYAVAAIVVFDLSRPPTFDAVLKWVSDIREKVTLGDGRPLPVLLLANKCDIDTIRDAMKWLVGRILEVRSNSQAPMPIVRTLAPEDPPEKPTTYCCR